MKSEYNKIILIIITIFTFSFYNCSNDVSNGKEGIIHFELTYLDGENSNPIITFLPNTMTYTFKKQKTIQKVEGWGGVFKMIGISDCKNDSVIALMKILGDKFLYKCKLGDDSFGYNPLTGIQIKYIDGEKTIAGYKCKKALGITDDKEYELYYTEEIKIEDANWNTPFKDVKGVLMQYEISMFGIRTSIIANKVEHIKIENSEFDIPEGYTCVEKKKIEETVYKFM